MASTSSFTHENSVPPSPWQYHVFLSFRGEDTRHNFTDHLYRALVHAGIQTFRDDDELRRGEDIASELLKAIEQSRVSMIVFSKNYADSRWCLDELVKILECKKKLRQAVLPVFYDVNPSDVRKQTGSFAEAFCKHEERYKLEMNGRIERWRAALTEAANLSGWDLHNVAKGHESKFIQKIVEEVSYKLNHKYFNIAIYPIGIDSRVEHLSALLNVGSDDVRVVGIYGMGGIGKTTIAKGVYNLIFNKFEGSSFLEDVRETAKLPNGLVQLQKRLLSEILLRKKVEISSVDRGKNMIKDRLRHKRVLIVFDDVDHLDQLNALAGEHNWFGPGSRIIITTRNEHLLKVVGMDERYMVPKLSRDESLRLFSWHAFRKNHPIGDYIKLSRDVVHYAGGLPLALEVLGCFLFDEASIDVWKSALEKLKKIPNNDILNKLRISFDGLNDDIEKEVFLDISCFFIGKDKDDVIRILDGCGFSSEVEIFVLAQRCLLTIDEDNKLKMHNLLRDMGREIVRQESPKEPGKRSRLWFHEDVHNVLKNHYGTSAVEGLIFNVPQLEDGRLSTEAFAKMNKLRLLQLNFVHLTGGYEHISKELRWLFWRGFPLKFIPTSFQLENLVAFDMRYSGLTQIWKENKVLKKLKVLNLSHSHYLIKTPNFLGLPSLERLLLKDCTSLVEVHPSIGSLSRLVFLNMRDCKNLRKLPRSICMLKSLENLILSGCSNLEELPEDLGNMERLMVLLADQTAIKNVPLSINFLKNLRTLSLEGCKGKQSKTSLHSLIFSWVSSRRITDSIIVLPNSLSGLCSLRSLDLANCNLLDDAIPADIGSLPSLLELDLCGNNFSRLPDTISRLSNLQRLLLSYCPRLQSVPELPTSLAFLIAINCSSLEIISNVSNLQTPPTMTLDGCHQLVEIQGLDKLDSIETIRMEWCNNLANTFTKSLQELSERCSKGFHLPGSEVPDWCSYQSVGSSVSFEVPPLLDRMIKGLTLCIVYSSDEEEGTLTFANVTVMNKTKGLEWDPSTTSGFQITRHDHVWVSHIPHTTLGNQLEGGDRLEVSVTMDYDGIEVKKCGIRLVLYEQDEKGSHSNDRALTQYNSSSSSTENAITALDHSDGDENVSAVIARPTMRGGYEDMVEPCSFWSCDEDEDDPNPKRLKTEPGP